MKYHACPMSTNCNPKAYTIRPTMIGTAIVITTSGDIVENNMCTYEIGWPVSGAGTNDEIRFRVNRNDRAVVTYIIGNSYTDTNTQRGTAARSEIIKAIFPQKVYLTIRGTGTLAMTLNIQTWIINNNSTTTNTTNNTGGTNGTTNNTGNTNGTANNNTGGTNTTNNTGGTNGTTNNTGGNNSTNNNTNNNTGGNN